ncbi:hypothetical protein LNTAR_14292 [Lentisphaera araneosa HTCC2155]|uniref:RmlD-like substrate binding domain-containing protein n=1 Tax=Lentisphaera araneosa HTCC2155 TaxID=313628 RepID=A6DHB0_9BACT|nr:hypothetical protein [Lentisphaera araneosa]EDM28993.1 hypothetical protein LNTAR_14292 [Lentisphaera araneosa HTCC2155]
MLDALIIGSGYLGSCLKKQFKNVQSSSLDQAGDFCFSLEDSPFEILPKAKTLIISCSIEKMGVRAEGFAEFAKNHYQKCILISTASLFKVTQANEIITDDHPLKAEHPRAINESYFRSFSALLYCGLLWDDHLRQPQKWLPRIKNGAKHVNLCKIDLVAHICRLISEISDFPPGPYVCSDTQALTWSDIADRSQHTLNSETAGIESKILSPQKLQSLFKSKIDWNSFVYCVKKEPK